MPEISIGVDIGGSLCKLALLHTSPLVPHKLESRVGLDIQQEVRFSSADYHLFMCTLSSVAELLEMIRDEVLPHGEVRVVLTGAGAIKHKGQFEEVLKGKEVAVIDEFTANLKGVEFIRRTDLPLNLTHFTSPAPGEVSVQDQQPGKGATVGDCKLPILFVSLGSGANFSKYVLKEEGLERVEAEDPNNSEDCKCFLAGTSLGGAFLAGLSQLTTGFKSSGEVFSSIDSSEELSEVFGLYFTNMGQLSVNQSLIHSTPSVYYGGSAVNGSEQHKAGFEQAMRLSLHAHPLQRSLLTLASSPGAEGSLGALYHAQVKQ